VNKVLPNLTYIRVKSMFGCAADLNTLTACQLKSTFGTKRLNNNVTSYRFQESVGYYSF